MLIMVIMVDFLKLAVKLTLVGLDLNILNHGHGSSIRRRKKLTPTVQSNVRRMGSAIHSDTMVEEENFRNPPLELQKNLFKSHGFSHISRYFKGKSHGFLSIFPPFATARLGEAGTP